MAPRRSLKTTPEWCSRVSDVQTLLYETHSQVHKDVRSRANHAMPCQRHAAATMTMTTTKAQPGLADLTGAERWPITNWGSDLQA